MKEVNKRDKQWYSQWGKRRKKKWKYVLIHGTIYWGFPVAIISFLLNSHFKIEEMTISQLAISLIIFGVTGIAFGLWQFKRFDTIYLGLNDDDKIKKGIEEIQSGQVWNYENLNISQNKNGILIIRNELFWYKEEMLLPEKLNECFQVILDDFRILQKNSDFCNFTKGKEVKIQIFDNSEKETPLIEKKLQ